MSRFFSMLLLLTLISSKHTAVINSISENLGSRLFDADFVCSVKRMHGTMVTMESGTGAFKAVQVILVIKDLNLSVARKVEKLNLTGIIIYGKVNKNICPILKNLPIVNCTSYAGNFLKNYIGKSVDAFKVIDVPDSVTVSPSVMKKAGLLCLCVLIAGILAGFYEYTIMFLLLPCIGIEKSYVWLKRKLVRRKFKNFFTLKLCADSEDIYCVICLGDAIKGEAIRKLPCGHNFHQTCIDPWLLKTGTCPLCNRKYFNCEVPQD